MQSRHVACLSKCGDTMKWKLWKKVMQTEVEPPKVRYCQCCGGVETRQTKLSEFGDTLPNEQTRLFPLPVRA